MYYFSPLIWLVLILVVPILLIRLLVVTSELKRRLETVEKKLNLEPQPTTSQSVGTEYTREAPELSLSMPTPPPPVSSETTQITEEALPKASSEELTGRWIGRIGVLALLIGVAFFLRFAFDNNWIGETGRVMLGLGGGVALMIFAHILRLRSEKYHLYSQIVSGGGVAIMYLSVYSALIFYELINLPIALSGLLAITVLSVFVGLIYEAKSLILLGIVGAFLTPVLMDGVNFDNPTSLLLLSYILVVNLGVVGVALFKHWPEISHTALLGSIFLLLPWFAVSYSAELFVAFFVFIFFFFLIFLASGILNSVQNPDQDAGGADLFFLTLASAAYVISVLSLIAFEIPGAEGFLAIFLALIYLLSALIVGQMAPQAEKLRFILLSFGVLLITVAIPLQLSGPWIAVAWLIESVVLTVVGLKMLNRQAIISAMVVFGIGLLMIFAETAQYNIGTWLPVINTEFALLILTVIVSSSLSYLVFYSRNWWPGATQVAASLLILTHLIALGALTFETSRWYQYQAYDLRTQFQQETRQDPWLNETTQRQLGVDRQAIRNIENQAVLAVNIIWGIYSLALIIFGFWRHNKAIRIMGIVLVTITAVKVFFDLWQLGEIYRIISSIGFGLLALTISFLYAKYRDIINQNVF